MPGRKLPYRPYRTNLMLPADAFREVMKKASERSLSLSFLVSCMVIFALENWGEFEKFIGMLVSTGNFPHYDEEE